MGRPPAVPYDDQLMERLKNRDLAAAYITACFEQDLEDDGNTFVAAIGNVARAQGLTEIASAANLGRENLYKALSEKGNPQVKTLIAVLKALHMRIVVERDANAPKYG
jgi:probable addiction module antidote protein